MAGYTRQDTADNISNGSVINADDLDSEFNALENAFNSINGHTHDGTSSGGAPITKVGPGQALTVTSTDLIPKTTNTLSLGTTDIQFKDGNFDGRVKTDTLVVDETSTFTGAVTASAGITGNLTGNVTGNVTGDLAGNVTGNVTGNVVGDVTGDLTGNVSGNLMGAVTGNLTGDVTGNVFGDVTGDLTGNVSGDVTGDLTGNVTGNLTGNVSGNVTGNVTGNVSGNVTGTVSSLSNHTTDNLTQGTTNKYFSNTLARNAFSLVDAGGDGSLTYNSSTGVLTYTGPSAAEVRSHFTAGGGIAISSGVISVADATNTEAGIATFADTDFTVANGNVTIQPERIQDIVGGMVTGNTESGLSVTYQDADGTLDFSLTGDPVITLIGDVTGSATMTNLGSVNIATTVAPNSVALGTNTTGNYVAGATGGTGVTITGTAGEGWSPTISIGQAVGTSSNVQFGTISGSSLTSTGNLSVGGDATISGDLTVTGTLTTTNTQELTVTSQYITVNDGQTTASLNGGLVVERDQTGINDKVLEWDETSDKWTVNGETFVAGTFEGDLTGNADTATTLATARTIGGVAFDGSANINLPGVNIAGSQNTTGNAATATKLQTARTVTLTGDVSGSANFDGSANISITATVADDSHNHVIANVDGLQTALDTKALATRSITAGNGLTGGGDLTANRTINVVGGGGITVTADAISHADTSSQASVNNTGRTYIQDITLDEYGHITGIASATETVVNTDTTYTAGTGLNLTGTTFSTAQDIATTASPTFVTVTANLSGNATTATRLATARTIAGQSFDGTANITIAPTDLTGVTATATEINKLDGFTGAVADLNYAKDLRATGVTATEFDYLDGVTGNIQTQINNLQTQINGKQDADADILKADTSDNLTVGYTSTADNDGNQSPATNGGNYTPDPATGNMKRIVNAGAFTLNAPTASGDYTIIIQMTNNSTAGTVTFSGFNKYNDDEITTTDAHDFFIYIVKLNGFTSARVEALQ